MSETIVYTDFNVSYDEEEVRAKLRVRPGTKAERELGELLVTARQIARPKAVLLALKPEPLGEGLVNLGGVTFKSRLLEQQLGELDIAFPYVATCGRELAEWTKSLSGLAQFLADEIMILALRQAMVQLEERLTSRYDLPQISAMNPGSLPQEWPITEQTPLFNLLGELPGSIGVELLPSLLMNPGKTVSGIFFKTVEKFHNCQLCMKVDCPSRKAPFQGDGIGLSH